MAGAFDYGSVNNGAGPKKWVTGTTYQEGIVVWAPSDDQYYMRKTGTSGAGTTDPASDTTNWQPTGDRAVKSIQRGSLTISGTTSATATISSVNTAKSELRFLGFETSGTDNTYSPRIALSNSTTVIAAKSTATGSVSVNWELTERY